MGKISVVVEDKSKTKDKVFGYLPLCDEVYRNRRLEQAKRVSQLYSMAEEAKDQKQFKVFFPFSFDRFFHYNIYSP